MAAARAALGGEAKIAGVKTFIATGRTRQVRGENLVPIEFEIQAELPDKYSRRDEFPAQDAGPVTAGFAGDALVLIPRPVPPPPRPGHAGAAAGRDGSATARAHDASEAGFRATAARHVRGHDAGVPRHLFVCRPSRSAARQSRRDRSEGSREFCRAAIHRRQRLADHVELAAPAGPRDQAVPAGWPPVVRHQAAVPAAQPAPPRQRSASCRWPPRLRTAGLPGAKPAPEQRLFFADYRDVDGLKLPFRIRRAAGSETTEETTFDRYRINAKVDPRRFDTTAK